MNYKVIWMRCLRNNRGQSLVEAALTLSITIVILFTLLAVGLYIYNMSVFVYSVNKALDKGVGMLSGTKPEYQDGMNGNELTGDDIADIKEIALNSLNIRIFTNDITENDVLVETREVSSEEVELKVNIQAVFGLGIPIINVVFPPLNYECSYVYKI